MRTGAFLGLVGATLAFLAAGLASADLCANCQGKSFIQNIGQCQVCRAVTSSGAFQLCPRCSTQVRQCQACRAPRGGGPAKEDPALKPLQPIDLSKSGTYQSGKWEYRLVVNAPGTKSEGRVGRLFYDGKELPQPNAVNRAVQTPWGFLFWVGVRPMPWGNQGWMLSADPRGGPVQVLPALPGEDAARRTTVGREANGQTVAVKLGDLVCVRLQDNPSTGYQWRITKLEGDAIEQFGLPGHTPDHPPGPQAPVGGGGTLVLTFRALRPGRATLTLGHFPPAAGRPPAETFTLTVVVEGTGPLVP